jgi:outer membrane receptor protein involved in Fe transport
MHFGLLAGKKSIGTTGVTPGTSQLGAEEDYDVFDLSGTFDLNEGMILRFGVDNLFDEQPIWTGGRTELDNNPSTGSGTTEAGFYDILGRTYYFGVSASF